MATEREFLIYCRRSFVSERCDYGIEDLKRFVALPVRGGCEPPFSAGSSGGRNLYHCQVSGFNITGNCPPPLCFRYWVVRSFGDWENTSKKTPKLQFSLSPRGEISEVARKLQARDRLPHIGCQYMGDCGRNLWYYSLVESSPNLSLANSVYSIIEVSG